MNGVTLFSLIFFFKLYNTDERIKNVKNIIFYFFVGVYCY